MKFKNKKPYINENLININIAGQIRSMINSGHVNSNVLKNHEIKEFSNLLDNWASEKKSLVNYAIHINETILRDVLSNIILKGSQYRIEKAENSEDIEVFPDLFSEYPCLSELSLYEISLSFSRYKEWCSIDNSFPVYLLGFLLSKEDFFENDAVEYGASLIYGYEKKINSELAIDFANSFKAYDDEIMSNFKNLISKEGFLKY